MIFRFAAAKIVIFLLLSILISPAGASDSESFSSTTLFQPMTPRQDLLQPSKSSVAGKLQRHHPERPIPIPQTTGPIVTDDAITQPYKTWSSQITPVF